MNKIQIRYFQTVLIFGLIVSEIISCLKDKDKKIISGNPDTVKKVYDTWKFSKDIKSTNPNWLLIDTQN